MDVRNRIRAFRIQAAQIFTYDKDVLWEKTARRVGGYGLDKQLFLMNLEEIHLSELSLLQIYVTNMENCNKIRKECGQSRTLGMGGNTFFLIH